jgi:hypothetical protein
MTDKRTGTVADTAQWLGRSPTTIRRYMRELGLKAPLSAADVDRIGRYMYGPYLGSTLSDSPNTD